jgi:hypothetical protein
MFAIYIILLTLNSIVSLILLSDQLKTIVLLLIKKKSRYTLQKIGITL